MSEKHSKGKTSQYGAQIGAQIGNQFSKNVQEGTNETIKGMNLFKAEVSKRVNVDIDQSKGNLFEYIEAVKFNRNAANAGVKTRAVVTDAVGRPHDAADIELVKDGKVIQRVQAKFVSKSHKTSLGGKTPDKIESEIVADTVYKQAGGGDFGKYHGMQRLVRKDESVNPNYESLLDREKQLANKRSKMNGIHSDEYHDVYENLTDELTDATSGVKSGGTSHKEVKKAHDDPKGYSRKVELNQYAKEVKTQTVNAAVAGAVTTGIISGVQNLFEVYKNDKELKQALKDVGIDTVKGAVKGGTTGFLASLIRVGGAKKNIPVISDSDAATVIAGGIIDCGVAVYGYATGELSGEELTQELGKTAVKSATAIYFTKAIKATLAAQGPFISMAIYSVASYVVTTTYELIKNAKLNAAEYNRLAKLNEEAADTVRTYRKKMLEQLEKYEQNQKRAMTQFLNNFDNAMCTGGNYDGAIASMVAFANETGIALQHTDFNDFSKAMLSNKDFVLK